MRIARRMTLLTVVAFAAGALMTSTAVAVNEEIDVVTEPGGVPCSQVTVVNHVVSGGCVIHVTGEVDLIGYPFGMSFPIQGSSCNVELTGRASGDGIGLVTSASFTDHVGENDCVRRPCTEELEGSNAFRPWPVSSHEEAGIAYLEMEFCLWNDGEMIDQRCRTESPITDNGTHSASVNQSNLEGVAHTTSSLPFGCGLRGQGTLEGTGLEVIH